MQMTNNLIETKIIILITVVILIIIIIIIIILLLLLLLLLYNNTDNNSNNQDLLRIIATAIFISAIAKFIPMQFLQRSRDKNLTNEKKN